MSDPLPASAHNPTSPDGAGEPVRQQILEATANRFRQYGYAKTTMAEIAGDCSMSAANLYRYFKNKADLIAALARNCLGDKLAHMDAVFADQSINVEERIERWIVESVEDTYQQWSELPRMSELVDDVCSSCPELVRDHWSEKHARLLKLLKEGCVNGEIVGVDDDELQDLTSAIISATVMFNVPHFMHMSELEAHRRQASQLAHLICRSLRNKTTV